MKISDILQSKTSHAGSDVVTLGPGDTVGRLLAVLAEHGIGAVVVCSGAERAVAGIVSERDVVRALVGGGAGLLDAPVSQIMTATVLSCAPDDDVDGVAATMTNRRIRHMPVLAGEQLVGLVSIGDVVFSRIRQLEVDRGQLEQYITG